jgi:ribosomal-protein-alanine N-acetyltransferase
MLIFGGMSPTENQPTFSAVSLRPATQDDLEQILVIEKKSYPHPWNQEHFVAEMSKPYAHVYVLTDDETDEFVAGYIVYWVQIEGVSLLNVAVHPDWRGLGYAQKLLQSMIKETVRDEISKINLEVRASNLNAIALYKKIGFSQTHLRKKFYANGEDAIVMELKTSDVANIIQ